MSRYSIPALRAHQSCVVGYDPPLGTFFAQIEDVTLPPEDERRLVLWVGAAVQEIVTVAALANALQGAATLPAEIQEHLARDQREIGFRPNFGIEIVRRLTPQRDKEDD